jgi:hypothetical protein
MAKNQGVGMVIKSLQIAIKTQESLKYLEGIIYKEGGNSRSGNTNGKLLSKHRPEWHGQLKQSLKVLQMYMLEEQGNDDSSKKED